MIRKTNLVIVLILSYSLLFSPLRIQAEEQKKQKIYFSSTSLSALLTSGNTRDFSFSMDTDQNLALDKHKFRFKGQIIHIQSNGEKKAEIYAASTRYNFQLNPRAYFLANGTFDRNVPSGYNFRLSFTSGAGYTWLDNKKVQISTEAAFGWSTENNAEKLAQKIIPDQIPSIRPNTSFSFVSSILTTKLQYAISSSTEFILQEAVFLDLRDFEGYRLYSYASISAAINQNFALKTSIQGNYENKPVPGFKNTDIYLLSSIVFKI